MSKRPISILLAIASNLGAATSIATIAVMLGTSAAAVAQSAGTQSTDDILRRLQAVEANNAALAKENAALREQIKLSEENTKLRDRVSELKSSNETATAQQPTISASALKRNDPKIALYDKASSPMVVKAPPPAPAPVPYSWTGFYGGIEFGGGWSDEAVNYSPNDPAAASLFAPTFAQQPVANGYRIPQNGLVGGFEAGYNWQWSNWLLGAEVDFSLAGMNGTASGTTNIGPRGPFFETQTTTVNESTDWYGTVRGRAGWLATPNLLLFGTGGFAYGRVNGSASYFPSIGGFLVGPVGGFSFTCLAGSVCFTGSSSAIRTGWTAGGGAEWLLDQHWSAKIEYQFVDLGTETVRVTALSASIVQPTPPASFNAAFRDSFNVVRVGLNYRY